MILIFSDSSDITTKKVCRWLNYFEKDYFLIDEKKNIKEFYITINNSSVDMKFNFNNFDIDLNSVEFIWYRRGDLQLFELEMISDVNNLNLKQFYLSEIRTLHRFIHTYFRKIPHLNNFNDNNISKLEVLMIASSVGLTIPNTIVTDSNNLLKVKINADDVITKAISQAPYIEYEGEVFKGYTNAVNTKLLPDIFFPTKFQNEIKKEFEIRTFYLNEKFYSMAIFSQSNDYTKLDYRNREGRENREIPFNLPENIECKLKKVIQFYEIASASFDFIYNDNEFVFLEMNVVGQIDNLSINCNYSLEEELALNIINGKG